MSFNIYYVLSSLVSSSKQRNFFLSNRSFLYLSPLASLGLSPVCLSHFFLQEEEEKNFSLPNRLSVLLSSPFFPTGTSRKMSSHLLGLPCCQRRQENNRGGRGMSNCPIRRMLFPLLRFNLLIHTRKTNLAVAAATTNAKTVLAPRPHQKSQLFFPPRRSHHHHRGHGHGAPGDVPGACPPVGSPPFLQRPPAPPEGRRRPEVLSHRRNRPVLLLLLLLAPSPSPSAPLRAHLLVLPPLSRLRAGAAPPAEAPRRAVRRPAGVRRGGASAWCARRRRRRGRGRGWRPVSRLGQVEGGGEESPQGRGRRQSEVSTTI